MILRGGIIQQSNITYVECIRAANPDVVVFS